MITSPATIKPEPTREASRSNAPDGVSKWVAFGFTLSLLVSCCSSRPLFAQQKETDGVIRFYQWRLSRDPDDYFNYERLGSAYTQKARETGDITYYELAEKALKRSLELESTHREAVAATTHLAAVYLAEHRFREALTYAQKALAFGTGDRSQYAIMGDAWVELGDYEKAAEAYSKLSAPESRMPLAGLDYLRESRLSNLRFLSGDPPGAAQLMREAIQMASEARMPAENVAWSQFQLGEDCFYMGDVARAEEAYQQSLATYPEYHRALAGLAKVRAAQGKYPESARLYERAINVIPLPTYAAALGDVYWKMGRADDSKKQYELVEFVGYLSAINQYVYNRELALFYADHDIKLEECVALAKKELEARQDIYTWDVRAWALYKNGRYQDAEAAARQALRMGTKDSLLLFHAGMIYKHLGDSPRAKDYLQRALALNPHFHVIYAEVAEQTLRGLSQTAVARKQ